MEPMIPSSHPQNPPSGDAFPLPQPPAVPEVPIAYPTPSSSTFNPPSFQNPLATSHGEHTQQLPNITAPVSLPEPPVSIEPPLPAEPVATPVAPYTPVPAPVRLAPEPRADDFHAAAHIQEAGAAPFSGAVPPTPPPTVLPPPPVRASQHRRLPLIVAAVAVIILALGSGLFILLRGNSEAPASPTPSVAAAIRDRAEKPTQVGLKKAETACYALQVPLNPTVNSQGECKLDLVYGEQKVSSIVVSTYRDFDLVTPTDSQNSAENRFNSDQFLQELIKNTTTGKTVIKQESLTVGNLPAQKIIVGDVANPATQVVYVYIVLPETDQQFEEKKFIAFIVTGAYNDEYSRKNFDEALKLWYWK